MTERRCISMGVGPKEHKHFHLYDIDTKDIDMERAIKAAPQALVIETVHGYHFITSPQFPITDEYLLSKCDKLCPANACRFYPHDDLRLMQRPTVLCIKVAHIYESVFALQYQLPRVAYEPCEADLKFGIYVAEKQGIKLTGMDRHPPIERAEP